MIEAVPPPFGIHVVERAADPGPKAVSRSVELITCGRLAPRAGSPGAAIWKPSTRGTEPLSYHLFASDYLGLLDQLQIPRVALVGTSDGAIIGLDIAVHHPERLSVLFLQGVNADPSGIQRPPLDFAAIKIALMRARDQYARLSPTPTEYDSFHHSLDKMAERDPNFTAADLRSIRVPTAVAMGDHEESIRWDHTAYIATTIPGAQQIRLPGVGHFAPLQDPGGFAQAVLQFVDKG